MVLQAGASHFARLFIGQTRGWAKGTPDLTPEDVRDHITEALETTEFAIPDSILEQIRAIGAVALPSPDTVDERFQEWIASLSQSSS